MKLKSLFSLIVATVLLLSTVSTPLLARETVMNEEEEQIELGKKQLEQVLSQKYIFDVDTKELIEIGNEKVITPNYASGGPEYTHQFIASVAVGILGNDDKTNQQKEILKYYSTFCSAADWPDDYENDLKTYSGHFGTTSNYLGMSSPTALTRFNYWMGEATRYYDKNNSNNTYAIQCLGIAFHYFSDLNAPHHAGNLPAVVSNHVEWENYAYGNQGNYVARNSSSYNVYGTNFADYALASANNAISQISNATSSDRSNWGIAAANTIRFNQSNGAALIDAFFRSEGIY